MGRIRQEPQVGEADLSSPDFWLLWLWKGPRWRHIRKVLKGNLRDYEMEVEI